MNTHDLDRFDELRLETTKRHHDIEAVHAAILGRIGSVFISPEIETLRKLAEKLSDEGESIADREAHILELCSHTYMLGLHDAGLISNGDTDGDEDLQTIAQYAPLELEVNDVSEIDRGI